MKNLSLAVIAVYIFLSVTDADVSHLTQYLPPSHHNQASATVPQSLYSSPVQSFQYHSSASQFPDVSVPAATSYSHGQAFAPAHAQAYNFASFASDPASTHGASASAPVQSYHFAASAPVQYQSLTVAASGPGASYNTDVAASAQSYKHDAFVPTYSQYYSAGASAPAASYDTSASAPVQSYNFAGLNSIDHYNAASSDISSFAGSNVAASLAASTDVQSYNFAAPASGSDASYSAAASVPVSVASSASDVTADHSYNAESSNLAAVESSHQAQESFQEKANTADVAVEKASASEPAPAHSFSAADGYHYKTPQSAVHRRRRDVSHLPSSEYLPPPSFKSAPSLQFAASAPVPNYQSASLQQLVSSEPETHYSSAASAAAPSFAAAEYESAPEQQIDYHESAASNVVPAHTFSSSEGYRYKTNRRRVIRRHRY